MANKVHKKKQQVLFGVLAMLALLTVIIINSQVLIEIKEVEVIDSIIMDTKVVDNKLSFLGHPGKYVATLRSGDIVDDIDSVTILENKVSGDTLPVRKVVYRNKITQSETYRLLPVLDENGFVILD